ncbi:type II toxin-antitoxin system VapC family toxin [Dehalococcoidia bacterium]|nr:type II toxin-antitoxin system VapC family toxin [Dehalococcoidia bacterium]MCL0073345.1 type II toxin-antitoxin system VapC family toxin [Dehalococcoidia bacterium]MCL0076107.1 type II toxin-antitoxin system VapC family toxin [Dehalococcoidia bacterium]
MVIADTSVWISHLRDGNPELENLLYEGEVVCHPFIVGELACGNIENRDEILSLLQSLPMVVSASYDEVLQFIQYNDLMGKGLGYIDVHLLTSAVLTDVTIWTLDKKLRLVSSAMGINYGEVR